jgi:hypothetical protein
MGNAGSLNVALAAVLLALLADAVFEQRDERSQGAGQAHDEADKNVYHFSLGDGGRRGGQLSESTGLLRKFGSTRRTSFRVRL